MLVHDDAGKRSSRWTVNCIHDLLLDMEPVERPVLYAWIASRIAGDWNMVTPPPAWGVTQCCRRHSRGCENEAFGPGADLAATSTRSATR